MPAELHAVIDSAKLERLSMGTEEGTGQDLRNLDNGSDRQRFQCNGRVKRQTFVATHNTRTISFDYQAYVEKTVKIKVDVIRISEARRNEELAAEWHTGDQHFATSRGQISASATNNTQSTGEAEEEFEKFFEEVEKAVNTRSACTIKNSYEAIKDASEEAPSRRSTGLQSHTKQLMAVRARMIVEGIAEGDEYKLLCEEIRRLQKCNRLPQERKYRS
ncbi:unnamed protein product [Anisakis simplex]|uniref:VASt domain-containing protein n=1 Tax=Anisakis simplex TaxID=6269 RepID=A0A0M3JSS3_ANISI|nr:unnamed protein product [Anisakis simplex]